MDVRGVGAFFYFLTSNGLNGVSPDTNAFIVCVEEYSRLCACDSPEFRESKQNNCRALYETCISRSDGLKSIFLSKTQGNRITFYSDHGKILKTFSR